MQSQFGGIDPWCNGNTLDFGSSILGSSPSGSTGESPKSIPRCRKASTEGDLIREGTSVPSFLYRNKRYMISKEKVRKLVEERIEGTDIFIVDIDIASGNNIRITLDADSGISIEKCMSVSRNVEHNLDRDTEDFSLEVSSFGLTSPFVVPRQYKKYIGRKVSVKTHDNKKVEGKLLSFDEQELVLELDLSKKQIKAGVEPKQHISLDDIKETKAVISFK